VEAAVVDPVMLQGVVAQEVHFFKQAVFLWAFILLLLQAEVMEVRTLRLQMAQTVEILHLIVL